MNLLHVLDGPQFSETVSPGGAEAANLDCPKNLDTPRGYAMAIRRHDATPAVILELEQRALAKRLTNQSTDGSLPAAIGRLYRSGIVFVHGRTYVPGRETAAVSFRIDSRFRVTSARICGQRTLCSAVVVRNCSSGTASSGSMP